MPQNTLVATGTDSGNTEAFLYPCLEHCRLAQQAGQRGVKVITNRDTLHKAPPDLLHTNDKQLD